MSSRARKKKKMTKRKRQKFKVIGLILMILLILLLAVVAVVVFFGMSKLNKLDRISIGKHDVEINELSPETEESLKGYTTLALFGLDNRSNGSFQSGNSDTIIVASINNDTGEIRMASVYRDTFLDIGDGSFNKANAAYNQGGPKKALNMLNKNLDLNITDYVSVDFNAVVLAVDAVGGIELDLTSEEVKYINGYIDEVAEVTGNGGQHITSPGLQTVNGVQATAYARIRYTSGADFKRTERQRDVIAKVFEKVKQASLFDLNSIVDTLLPEISTSLDLTEMLGMAKDAGKYSMGENTGFPFERQTAHIGNITYAEVAVDFEANVKQLHQFLYGNENYTPSTTVQQLSEAMRNQAGF